jgi:hypothetical protein
MSLMDKIKKGKKIASEMLKDASSKTGAVLKDAGSKTGEVLKEASSKTSEVLSDVGSKTGEVLKGAGSKTGEVFDDAAKLYKESVVKEKLDIVTGATSNQLDVISGQKMYDLVQERVELQNEINDVLAFKLQEALNRIESLEKQLDTLKDKS